MGGRVLSCEKAGLSPNVLVAIFYLSLRAGLSPVVWGHLLSFLKIMTDDFFVGPSPVVREGCGSRHFFIFGLSLRAVLSANCFWLC